MSSTPCCLISGQANGFFPLFSFTIAFAKQQRNLHDLIIKRYHYPSVKNTRGLWPRPNANDKELSSENANKPRRKNEEGLDNARVGLREGAVLPVPAALAAAVEALPTLPRLPVPYQGGDGVDVDRTAAVVAAVALDPLH